MPTQNPNIRFKQTVSTLPDIGLNAEPWLQNFCYAVKANLDNLNFVNANQKPLIRLGPSGTTDIGNNNATNIQLDYQANASVFVTSSQSYSAYITSPKPDVGGLGNRGVVWINYATPGGTLGTAYALRLTGSSGVTATNDENRTNQGALWIDRGYVRIDHSVYIGNSGGTRVSGTTSPTLELTGTSDSFMVVNAKTATNYATYRLYAAGVVKGEFTWTGSSGVPAADNIATDLSIYNYAGNVNILGARMFGPGTHRALVVSSNGGVTIQNTLGSDPTGGTQGAGSINIAGSYYVNGVALANPVTSGTYSPTLTNVANLDASTTFTAQYLRVGAVVTVSGRISVDPTTSGLSTILGISLPIASILSTSTQCAGVAGASGIAGQVAAIAADTVNNRAEAIWVASDITNQSMFYTYTYTIV